MLESCGSRRYPTVDTGQRQKCLPKVAAVLYTITCLAIIILGALALAGVFNPTSSLGILGHTFGKLGASLLIGIGALLLFGNAFYCYPKKVARVNWHDQISSFEEEGHDNHTGASRYGDSHSNLKVTEDYYN